MMSDSSKTSETTAFISSDRFIMDRLKEQLKFKDAQLESARKQLKALTLECRRMQRTSLELNGFAGTETQVYLKEKLEQKEREIFAVVELVESLAVYQTEGKKEVKDYIDSLLQSKENFDVPQETPLSDELSDASQLGSNLHDVPLTELLRLSRLDPQPYIGGLQDESKGEIQLPTNMRNLEIIQRKEVLLLVFAHLDIHSLLRVSRVCRLWREVSHDPVLWKRVRISGTLMSTKMFRVIASRCKSTQSLTLQGVFPVNVSDRDQQSPRGLLEEGLECLLKACHNSLLSIRIEDCRNYLTDRSLWLASCYCRGLRRLAYLSYEEPAGTESIYALGAGCRDINTLIIPPLYPNSWSHRVNDTTVQMISQCWPHLIVLCIGGIDVSPNSLVMLAERCQQLQVLELDHMWEVDEQTAIEMCHRGLKDLTTLHLTFTPAQPNALLNFHRSCPKLKTINMRIKISDYFEDTNSLANQQQFQHIVSKFKALKSKELTGKLWLSTSE